MHSVHSLAHTTVHWQVTSGPSGLWPTVSVTYMACSPYLHTAPNTELLCTGEVHKRYLMLSSAKHIEKVLPSFTCAHLEIDLKSSLPIRCCHCAVFCMWRRLGEKSNPNTTIKCTVCIPSSLSFNLKNRICSRSVLHFDYLLREQMSNEDKMEIQVWRENKIWQKFDTFQARVTVIDLQMVVF